MECPPLHALSARGREIVLAYFAAGRVEGIAAGRRQVEAELAAEWAALKAEVMPRIVGPSYAELAQRRGMHDAAERQRQILRDRGIAS